MHRSFLADAAYDRALTRTAGGDRLVRQLLAPFRGKREGFAVFATGGYARADLAPQSDLDIVILTRDPDRHTEMIHSLIQGLWSGPLKPAHTLLTFDDMDGHLFTIPDRASSLLETRLIWGDTVLARRFEAKVNELVDGQIWKEYVAQKREEFRARRAKYGDVARVIEPHLKNQAGGMRDMHHTLWLERAVHARRGRWKLRRRRGNMIRAFATRLRRDHLLTGWEADQLVEAYGFLLAVRELLHDRRGRGDDRLLVSEQAGIGRSLGYEGEDVVVLRDLMRDVYWSGEKLSRFCNEFGPRFSQRNDNKAPPVKVPETKGVTVDHGRLELSTGAVRHHASSPDALLKLIDLSVEKDLPLSGRSRHRLRRALHVTDSSKFTPAHWSHALLQWLKQPSGFSARMRRLDELDAINLWLPEWRHINGLSTGSYYHLYTVDEHTLRALKRLDDLPDTGLENNPLALWQSFEDRPLVYYAIIFHDIAKGMSGDHSENGAAIARDVLTRLHMQQYAEPVARLVEIHLRMEQTAFRRDFTDPETILEFARLVGDERTLAALYILTVCDLSAVRENVWTAWKSRLLSELYLDTRDVLRRGIEVEKATVAAEVDRVAPLLAGGSESRDRAEVFIAALREEYRRSVYADEIARHLETVEQLQKNEFTYRWLIDRHPGYILITLITRDRHGLLANIAGLLTSQGIGVREARIFTREDGIIIDRFRAEDVETTAIPLEQRLKRIPELWEQLDAGDIDVESLFQSFERRSRAVKRLAAHVETGIKITVMKGMGVIDVSGPDITGVLYRLCKVLADEGFDVRSARVTGRVDGILDSFLVDDPSQKLTDGEQRRRLRVRLREAAYGE